MKNHTYDVYEHYKIIKENISHAEVKQIVGNINLTRYVEKGYQINGKYTVKIHTHREEIGYPKFPVPLMEEWDRVRLKILSFIEKEKNHGK